MVSRGREHGEAVGHLEVLVLADPQPADVLPSDLGVGAHVDDVDSLDIVLQALDCLGDHPASDEGLAQSDLIGHQEAGSRRLVLVEPGEHVVHGPALEVFELAKHRLGDKGGHDRFSWR